MRKAKQKFGPAPPRPVIEVVERTAEVVRGELEAAEHALRHRPESDLRAHRVAALRSELATLPAGRT